DILKIFGMENYDTVPTPMVEQAKFKLDLVGKPVDHTDYRSMIESLIMASEMSFEDDGLLVYLPQIKDVRCFDSPGSDKKRGGITRFALIFCLTKVKTLNRSEVTRNENNYPKVVKVLQDVLEIVTNDMMRNGSSVLTPQLKEKVRFSTKELNAYQHYVSIGFHMQKIFPGMMKSMTLQSLQLLYES
nr:tubulin-folding cofactor E [Tanacetum cinerariifolium]